MPHLIVDLGHPFLNLTVDGFLKIGAVAAAKVVAEDTYDVVKREPLAMRLRPYYGHVIEAFRLKKMCKEGAYWGTVAGVYVGMEYGAARIREECNDRWCIDWCACIAATKNNRDKIVMDAIAGCAVATAAELLNYLT
ncbi:hypothetical protein DH2020_007003 [Rehmannia glutinosa]|uniref:Uncharacterized protein n=1 Tax=Rehmannia glutinosa TaxID=99300 RepID=A0ABR0W7G7_REHGL